MLVDPWKAPAESAGRRFENGPQGAENGKEMQKDTKIEGTNSTSPLESTKVAKNELKTNSILSAKMRGFKRKSGF